MTRLEILLVDDQAAGGARIAESLRAGGIDALVERVETEQAFRDALRERHWDAVLAGWGLAGFGAAQALRVVGEEGRALPVLVLAPSPCPAEALDLLRQGADDVVPSTEGMRLGSALRRALAEADGRRARREAERRARIMRLAVDHAPVAVLVTDRAGVIEYVNPRFQTLTGWTEADVLGRTPGILKSGYTPPESYEELWRTVTAGDEWRGEFLNRTRDGDLFWAAATIAPVRDEEGRITHFVAVEEDVTMRKLYEERLFRQANYDELTGLPNRTLLADRLVEALRTPKRAGVAVMAVDLDDFKRINESLGHGAGDAILREAGARLVEAVGPSGVVARLGDDDFAVLLPGIEGPDDAGTIAGMVIESFRRPYKAGPGEAVVTASIGLAVAPGDGDEANRLLGSATMAMVMAKKQGGDRFRFFAADMEKRARRRFEVESQLRRALARGELELALQPIYAITGRRMAGVEALIRWDSPVLGRVAPEGFIPLAETSGLIEPIGAWVLEEACRQVAHLRDAGHDLFVAVNVSPAQFGSGTLPQAIETALAKSGLPPRSLEIEITESLLLTETPALAGIMAELTRLGVRLSLDDFGTGYSSLAYLRRWPFETLKIDRSFVSDVIASRDAAVLVEAVIAMAHRLNLRVVAEGVETRAQLDFLAERRCDLAQGHLLGRPGDWRAVLAALDGEAFSP